ncbi:MAG TPA: tetratricopeptide repeat protein [Vicinamibacterales bacterium]|nr:tetratricopeptide repeat protein [Vicinamibacterales bacterium]
MKAQERHHLKQNEFAITTAKLAGTVAENRSQILMIGGGVLLVGVIAGGWFYLQKQKNDAANALFGAAMRVEQSQIVPAPTLPGATQQAGTFATEQARNEAAVAAYQKVIDAYPSHDVGLVAKFHLAGIYLSMGRAADAATAYADVASRGGGSMVGSTAKLGQAQALVAQSKFDEAIKVLTDLSGQRDGELPMDGVLMELARVCQRAGKTQDARAAFKRVVDEFPQSGYAGEARQQLATMG